MSRNLLLLPLLLATGVTLAADTSKQNPVAGATVEKAPSQEKTKPEEKAKEEGKPQTEERDQARQGGTLGMSILGNQEAPKALVIVPWKSSELGHSVGISPMLDDSRQPVDKEAFLRALVYYEIRSGRK